MKGISGAVNRFSISSTARTNIPTRRRVECGADVPGAGHFSCRGLQATEHSASGRAGTVVDGQNQQIVTNPPVVTIGDGRPTWPHHATNQPSRTQYQTEFSSHPARSAHTRCIHPASGALTSISDKTERSTECVVSYYIHPKQHHPMQR